MEKLKSILSWILTFVFVALVAYVSLIEPIMLGIRKYGLARFLILVGIPILVILYIFRDYKPPYIK